MTEVTFEEADAVALKHIEDFSERKTLNSELTVDDWHAVSQYVWAKFSSEEMGILHTYDALKREFTIGHRCGVCGRTKAQNEAIGYNCYREC